MSSDPRHRSEAEAQLEREIRQGRKFTPQEALGRMAGPGAMKGASAVSPLQQAEIAVGNWLRGHVSDSSGALRVVLERHLAGSRVLLENIDRPLVAMAAFFRRVLTSDQLLREMVREVDVEWGRMMDERPRFDREGEPESSDDPYTVASVRRVLEAALKDLIDVNG